VVLKPLRSWSYNGHVGAVDIGMFNQNNLAVSQVGAQFYPIACSPILKLAAIIGCAVVVYPCNGITILRQPLCPGNGNT